MSFYIYETTVEKKGDVGMDAIDIARRYLRGEAGFDARDLNGAIRRLIEQAERAQELKKENFSLNNHVDGLLQKLEDKEPYYSMRRLVLDDEYKRLREALEFYANADNFKTFDSPAVKDYGQIACQALEGVSNDQNIET